MSRKPGPAMLALQDAVAAALRQGGQILRVAEIETLVREPEWRWTSRSTSGVPIASNVRLCCERLVKLGIIEKLNGPAIYGDSERAQWASGAEVAYRWIEPDVLNDTAACIAAADVTLIEMAYRLPAFGEAFGPDVG